MSKVKIRTHEDKIVERKPKMKQFGNFVMAIVRYDKHDYLLNEWDGDEYIRGIDTEKIYTLGKRLPN